MIDLLINIYIIGILIHTLCAVFLIKTKSNSEYTFVLICIVGWPVFLVIEIFEYFQKRKKSESE